MPQRLRIFVSSPADVPNERLRADLIVDKLAQDYSRFFSIESYRWEHEAMIASAHFQDAIEPPSAFDIVVLILWSRLGTPLPEKTAEREYRGIDGRVPVTGTEWEYEEALKVAREKKAPDLLAFRNVSPAPIDPRDADAQAASMAQLAALNAFWTRHFADRGVFLSAYDEYYTLEEFARRLEESLRKLIERRIRDLAVGAGASTEALWTGDPFRGLEPYEFEHAPIFFGRDAAVTKATEQLAANARAGHAFVLVSGASGSGKSSLVKAGMVPRVMKPQRISGLAFLRRAVFRPASEGTDIVLGLANALTRAGGDSVGLPELIGPGQDAAQLAAYLRSAANNPDYLLANALGRLTDAERKSGRLLAIEEAKLILVIDQLEELFTAPGIGTRERQLFIALISGLARSGAVWVIATLRADFWHRAADMPDLVALAEGQGRIDLAAPSSAELAEMIRRPAQAAGLSFEVHAESGLPLDAVLAEHAAAAPGALPLLSFALYELFRIAKARGSTVLTHASYQALGGLEGAIAKRADEILAQLHAPARAALPRVLRALTTVTGTTDQGPVARSAPLDSFVAGGPARTLIDAFIAARLLIAASEGGVTATVRLAHEALISRWQRARDQLAADRRDLETRTLVERQFERWSQASGGARRQLLLRNPDLANASDLARRWGDELDAPVRNFIKRSGSRARLAQTLTAVAAVLFALVAGAAVYAERRAASAREDAIRAQQMADTAAQQAVHAQGEAERRQINLLAEVATSERLRGNLVSALRLSVHAARLALDLDPEHSETSAPRTALATTLWQSQWRIMLGGHEDGIFTAVFSPDGKRAVTASADQTARIWEAATGKTVAILRGHTDYLRYATFSPDGARVATAADDKTVRIWDAATGRELQILRGSEGEIDSAAFSSDGTRIVASSNKTARIWDIATGNVIAVLRGHDGRVNSAVFSPDGTRVVTASGDKTARIWDGMNGNEIAVLRGHEGDVYNAIFSPDGTHVVTTSSDKTARIWDAGSAKVIAVLQGHEDTVFHVAYSRDGEQIVTASFDMTARTWTAATGKPIATLRGHRGSIESVAFSPDGTRVVTASDDDTARIWDAANGQSIAVLRGHSSTVYTAEFSPDGASILTASADATARIWDAAPDNGVAVMRGSDGFVSAAYSPDGTRIVTASFDKTARIWDAASNQQTTVLRGHDGVVWSAVFSPDGTRIVTASGDKTARVWDAATGKQITILSGHAAAVSSATFSPDGSLIATASEDKTARIWDAATGKQIEVLSGHADAVSSAAFSPDGKRIVTASKDETARVWDAATGKQIALLRHYDAISSAAFSPDGGRIVTATTSAAYIWDAKTLQDIAVSREANVSSATFSPDGTRILTSSPDRTARVWDSSSGNEIAVLRGQEDYLRSAAFSPDGERVVTASSDGTARNWNVHFAMLSAKGLLNEVCVRRLLGFSTLTRDEMRLAGYPDTTPPIDICTGVE